MIAMIDWGMCIIFFAAGYFIAKVRYQRDIFEAPNDWVDESIIEQRQGPRRWHDDSNGNLWNDGGFSMENSTNCKWPKGDMTNCHDCSWSGNSQDSFGLSWSHFCTYSTNLQWSYDCEDCHDSDRLVGCSGLRDKRGSYWVNNKEVSPEEYDDAVRKFMESKSLPVNL